MNLPTGLFEWEKARSFTEPTKYRHWLLVIMDPSLTRFEVREEKVTAEMNSITLEDGPLMQKLHIINCHQTLSVCVLLDLAERLNFQNNKVRGMPHIPTVSYR